MKLIVVLCLALVVEVTFGQDYCSTELCGSGDHVACGNSGEFAASCPSDAAQIVITDQMKKAVLNAHNEKRNFIAGGGDPKLEPACRMPTMKWDDELSYLASLNTLQCEMKHDPCRSTVSFKYSGQNLARIPSQLPANVSALLITATEMWYGEVTDTLMEYIDAFPSNYNGPAIGHFTGMMGDLNTHVGCAVSTYDYPEYPGYKNFLIACNYANTNIVGFPIYKSCATPASECTKGVNCNYANLCSASEPVDPNNVWRN